MMRKIIVRKEDEYAVYLDELKNSVPIFAKKAGKLVGMIVLEYQRAANVPIGWILREGGEFGAYGHSDTREECVRMGQNFGYEFFVED